ncbi:MAG: hypothetical protein ACI8UO_000462 [Verrucomicrobiales bacterium]|jgi:hypothetical protein
MTATQLRALDGTVTDHGNLFLALEMHAEAESKRGGFRRALRDFGQRFLTRVRKTKDDFNTGFAPQPLVEKVASAALFDSSAPILVRHRQLGALSQFFSCRLLPYMDRNAVCGGLAEVSDTSGFEAASTLSRAIQSLAPGLNLKALDRMPMIEWARYLERKFRDPGPQKVLVVQHFDEFCQPFERSAFRQFFRRLARISGFSVVVGVRGRTGSRKDSAKKAPAGWARPGKPLGVLDLNQQIWTPPAGPNSGLFFDSIYRHLGPWVDAVAQLRILHPFHHHAAEAEAARMHAH